MTRFFLALATVGGLASLQPAPAQVIVGPVGVRFGFGFGNYAYGFGGPGYGFGGAYRGSYWSLRPVYGPVGIGPYGPYAGTYVSPYATPFAANPYFGYSSATVVVTPRAAAGRGPAPGPGGLFANLPDDRPPDNPGRPAVPKGDFLVVKPAAPVPAAKPAPPAIRDPKFDPFELGGGGILPPGDPPKEARALAIFEVSRARSAFAAEQYGRAGERLAAAIAANPDDPVPYFLLAQAHVAAGDYIEAVAAIRDGMKRDPDWPASGFRLREIYGKAPARLDAHFGELRRAAAANPDDPTLEFLLGYHLWFLGEKADAAKLFRRAVEKLKEPGIVERFLLEADGRKA